MKKSLWTNYIILKGRSFFAWVKLTQNRKERLLSWGFVNRFECTFHVQIILDFETKGVGIFHVAGARFVNLFGFIYSAADHKEGMFIN